MSSRSAVNYHFVRLLCTNAPFVPRRSGSVNAMLLLCDELSWILIWRLGLDWRVGEGRCWMVVDSWGGGFGESTRMMGGEEGRGGSGISG